MEVKLQLQEEWSIAKKKGKPMPKKLVKFLKDNKRFPKTKAEKIAAGVAPKGTKKKAKSSGGKKKMAAAATPNRSGGGGRRIYIAVLLGFVLPPLMVILDGWLSREYWPNVLGRLGQLYTGLNVATGQWDYNPPLMNYGSILMGIGASKILGSWLGVNRRLPKHINL